MFPRRQYPARAHLFELPNKIGLPQDRWFIAQSMYALICLAIMLRGQGAATLAFPVRGRLFGYFFCREQTQQQPSSTLFSRADRTDLPGVTAFKLAQHTP